MFTFLIGGCGKSDKDINKEKDALDLKPKVEEIKEVEGINIVGKFTSEKAPGMVSEDNFTWYFYPKGYFIVMKENVFGGEEKPSTDDVKYGQYKFVDDNVFKISYIADYDLSSIVFVVDGKDIIIQNLNADEEVLLENVPDKKFENELSKASLYGGKYQLFVDGVRKFHGAYIEVKKDGIVELYEAFKKIGEGRYYIFENYVLIPSGNGFVFNELESDYKAMVVPNTDNVLRYQE